MSKRQPIDTAVKKETCVLIGLATQYQKREQLEEYLEELAFLVTKEGPRRVTLRS